MANRPVSLFVHRNNRAQREAKRIRSMFKDDVKAIAAIVDIAGYAVIAWDTERGYRADWYTPRNGPIGSSTMPEYVRVSLLRELVKADTRRIVWPSDDDEAG